jgi:hypothetical protein
MFRELCRERGEPQRRVAARSVSGAVVMSMPRRGWRAGRGGWAVSEAFASSERWCGTRGGRRPGDGRGVVFAELARDARGRSRSFGVQNPRDARPTRDEPAINYVCPTCPIFTTGSPPLIAAISGFGAIARRHLGALLPLRGGWVRCVPASPGTDAGPSDGRAACHPAGRSQQPRASPALPALHPPPSTLHPAPAPILSPGPPRSQQGAREQQGAAVAHLRGRWQRTACPPPKQPPPLKNKRTHSLAQTQAALDAPPGESRQGSTPSAGASGRQA